MRKKEVKVLLLEDDILEQFRFMKTIEQLAITAELYIVGDGHEAMNHLERSKQLPDLILTDLYMPGQNGFEFLKELKANPALNYIPTIAFTTSNDPEDIRTCYELGVASYILKSHSSTQYKSTVIQIFKYWKKLIQFK
ncbi:response regulator [uncultured Algoriphagus sp.]|uniref:response regulator n=1 Tax=uncultured Algoriphagus sp. TaxID=417365 RepID=UPI0030ED36B8